MIGYNFPTYLEYYMEWNTKNKNFCVITESIVFSHLLRAYKYIFIHYKR